jgi:glycosyltransferase involved in cell wall biosynthesis
MKPSLSVVIPALNEEVDLEGVVRTTVSKVRNYFRSYELIIINDGSSDGTAEVAERLAREDSSLRVIHHEANRGLGYSLREGFDLATKDYVTWAPGDHGMIEKSFDYMFEYVGSVDVVISYISDPRFRSVPRRIVSRLYTAMVNSLFDINILYYNGPPIFRTEVVQAVRTSTYGFTFGAELMILLIKGGCTYVEVPTFHQKRTAGHSTAFTFRNLSEIFRTMTRLFVDARFRTKKKYIKQLRSIAPVGVGLK